MKKIYLLSAVACMFAFAANAQDKAFGEYGFNEWWTDGAASAPFEVVTAISGTDLGGEAAKVIVPKPGNDWDVEFCNILRGNKGQEPGATFFFDCDVFWSSQAGDTADLRLLTGKIGSTGHEDWQWDADANTELITSNEGGFWGYVHNQSRKIAKNEWTHVSWGDELTLGEKGAEYVGIQINLDNTAGTNLGVWYFRNIVIKIGKKTTLEYYMASTSAVDEVAAVNAFVAGDVLYASEAADVVVYNISGVAVKAAKNVTSLSVSDLKAGLYIAKVGNKTIKFVK
ncbi:MAG: T9SS type A sorting domain-containing protein [Salinivirgaceae bacterium]|nr:T9SS type A sorting domain-containing protein [Salinivirgaceae bacterium]